MCCSSIQSWACIAVLGGHAASGQHCSTRMHFPETQQPVASGHSGRDLAFETQSMPPGLQTQHCARSDMYYVAFRSCIMVHACSVLSCCTSPGVHAAG